MPPNKDTANKKRKAKDGETTAGASDVWLLTLDEDMEYKNAGRKSAHAVYSSKEKAIAGLADFLDEHLFWGDSDECKRCIPGFLEKEDDESSDYSEDGRYTFHGDSIGDSGILLENADSDDHSLLTVHLKRLGVDPVRTSKSNECLADKRARAKNDG